MANTLFVLLVALVLAYFFSEILRFFKIPRVIGQISAGMVLGLPYLRNTLFTEDVSSIFYFIANVGTILLFFFVGLEINMGQFKKNFKESFLISIFNTLIPLATGFLIGKFLFNFNDITSLVIGIALAVSSQAISLDILEELKLLKTRLGSLIVSSGTVDDVLELLLISFILVLFQSSLLGQDSFVKLAVGILSFVLIIIMFKISLVPIAMKVFEREKSQSNLFMGALIVVLLLAYISELAGVGTLIGALIAGILVRQTLLAEADRQPWRKNAISHSMHIVSFGFLIPIFFVNVGLNTNFNSLFSNLFLVVVLILANIVTTVGGTVIGVLLSKGTLREGLLVGWGVTPKGDTELIIATLALNNGLIDSAVFSAIIAVALVSTFLAPIVFKYMIKKYSTEIK